ncbi:cytochrome C oxidase subunit IV family protein [Chitinophaga horti]|uniref:Cytochrome C oxidase subunit IV family protein n=1 Tax=Chitinophaga horti TaxID=2920382 RepID=A0ABY6IYW7_9BACT|nr:cytochrome C oxidase subunit IV family protein [Chitinophaga horti]UYQ92570.1 cytochrome C oxidase subunit IV family protein [Chitinophaga horti]
MAHVDTTTEQASSSTSSIWRTFWILLGITVFEIILAFAHLEWNFMPKMALNGVFVILTVVKAFYIVAEFMHLGHEIKNLILSVLVPLVFFVWFIIAFLADGDSWKNMRKDLSPGRERKIEMAPKDAHGGHGAKPAGNHH